MRVWKFGIFNFYQYPSVLKMSIESCGIPWSKFPQFQQLCHKLSTCQACCGSVLGRTDVLLSTWIVDPSMGKSVRHITVTPMMQTCTKGAFIMLYSGGIFPKGCGIPTFLLRVTHLPHVALLWSASRLKKTEICR